MADYFLAIDIGASSGRHILGNLSDGRLHLEEIHRFENGVQKTSEHLVWDYNRLFSEIKTGMRKCSELGKIPQSVGIDTWGVDYVLLGKNDELIGSPYAYRDSRTDGIPDRVSGILSDRELYSRTGIQRMQINTIYQLYAQKLAEPEVLPRTKTFLFTPDYFHFLLTGRKLTEYTIASTSGLLDVKSGGWDTELITQLGLDPGIFLDPVMPGTAAGTLREEIAREIGYSCKVILPASHDTASAFMAVPNPDGDSLYISSGTWSLMGCELPEPLTTVRSTQLNFTNEGGYDKRYRYLKNIMGLWMIQSARNEMGRRHSFEELCKFAAQSDIPSIVDCDMPRFLAPESMISEIQAACRESGQRVPESPGEIAAVIYNSLAKCYGDKKRDIERLTGKTFHYLNVIGGGSQADYLNMLTAKATGCPVFAGPAEATAIGNLLAQMIAAGKLKNLRAGRELIQNSFEIRKYE